MGAGAVHVDVVVVGGGIAGSALALSLRARGLSVAVVEKQRFPRPKPCGEGLLPHGVEKLAAIGLPDALPACEAQPFKGILYRCHGVVARGDFEGGRTGFGVRRTELDALVHARAREAGADVVEEAATAVVVDDEGAAAVLKGGARVRGRFLVGADGPRSLVRHALALDGGAPDDGRYAVRRHFLLPAGAPMPERVEVTVVDGYELYVTPVAPRTVGVAALCERRVMQGGSGRLEERLQRLVDGAPEEVRARLHGAEPVDDALACGPLRVKAKDVCAGPCLLVGDAAGYVDAITGEGMSLALVTAALAAEALDDAARGRASREQAFARYRRLRARAFRDHALLTHGLVFLARNRGLARRAVARLRREPALFSRLLAVNDGRRSLLSLGVLDALKLAAGAAPDGDRRAAE